MTHQDIIQKALAKGISPVEVYCKYSSTQGISALGGKVEKLESKELLSISIRGVSNGKMGSVSCESLDNEIIDDALNRLILNASLITAKDKQEAIFDGKGTYQKVPTVKNDFDKHSTAEKIELVKEIEKIGLATDKRIVSVNYSIYQEESTKIIIVNSYGVNLEAEYSSCGAACSAIASDGNDTTNSFYGKEVHNFDELDPKFIAEKAAKDTCAKLGAKKITTGNYPVVFDRDVASSLVAIYSTNFSGENAMYKISPFVGKVGEKIFGDNITIVNDPFNEKALNKIPFDDEGVPCRKYNIVEKGIFKQFYHSQASANYFKEELTGNGDRGPRGITASPINMYLEPGEGAVEDLFKDIKEGVYVTSVGGLHAGVNPISGTFNIQSSGFMIRDGKKAEPVTLFVVSGTFLDMFNNITGIADDIEENYSRCASPSLKVKSLMVSGK